MQRKILLIALIFVLPGCAARYVTPGGGVSLARIDDTQIREYYERMPASPLPANLAIVRVQGSGYVSLTNRGYGTGRYSVITTRDIETEAYIDTIRKQPLIAGVTPLGRMLLPSKLDSIKDLRLPAAQLKADMLLIYSVDTQFSVEGKSFGPLSVISLGLLRNKKANVTATVAAILVDVRSGFVYGAFEASATEAQRASIWSTRDAIDNSRIHAEKLAFDDFVNEFPAFWKGVADARVVAINTIPSDVEAIRPEQNTAAPGERYYSVKF